MQYVKKPVVIEAVQWTGGNLREIIDFMGLHPSAEKWTWEEYEGVVRREGLKIFTLEGIMMAGIGDFIIKGVNGEYYPCKPDIFEKTYSPYKPRRVPGPDGSLPLTEEEMKEFNEKFYPDTLTLKVSASGLFILRNAEKHIVNNYKAVQYLLNIFNLL
jgi:hypothetical protein